MQNLTYLMQLFNSHLKTSFNFKMTSKDLTDQALQFINNHTTTKTGKRKAPIKHSEALRALMTVKIEELRDQQCIFCYRIDGELFTTYNKDNKRKYTFKGETAIQNYRVAGKENRLHELHKDNKQVESGFYYACGKPFFVM